MMHSATPIADIQAAVAAHYRQPCRIMRARERAPAAAYARQVAMYLAYSMLGKPKSDIARRFERDRTTVWHAVHAVEARLAVDPVLRADVAALRVSLAR